MAGAEHERPGGAQQPGLCFSVPILASLFLSSSLPPKQQKQHLLKSQLHHFQRGEPP